MKEIIENTLTIGKFMGVERCNCGCNLWKSVSNNEFTLQEPSYHSSWDDLMPVIEKIESLNYWVENRYTYVAIGKKDHENSIISNSFSSLSYTKIEAIYKTVVQFIKWYNEQNK